MKGCHKSLLWTILFAALASSCTQRSYVMSFSQSEGMTSEHSSSFGSHATLEVEDQTPSEVTAPNQYSASGQPRPSTQSQNSRSASKATQPTPLPTTPFVEAQNDAISIAETSDDQPIVNYDHSFTGNETEHIKFSAYDPFGGTMTSFGVDLDAAAVNFTYPINGKFSSGYGRRGRGTHSGVDLIAPLGTPIYAAFDGVVRLAKPYSGYGNVIVVRHNNGLETVYAHNSKNLVAVGQSVKSGQQIALCGRTGRASTEHLHFEVRIKGQTINPMLLIDVNQKRIQRGQLIVSRAPSGSISAKLTVAGEVVDQTEPQLASGSTQTTSPQAAPTTDGVLSVDNTQVELPPATASIAPSYQSRGIRVGDTVYDNPSAADEGSANPSKPSSTTQAKYHTIVGGDTLSGIAQKYHTTVTALCSLNNITKNVVIRTGKKLRVK